LIPFAPLQKPVAVGYNLRPGQGCHGMASRTGKPKDLSAFKNVYDSAVKEAKKNIDLFKNNPDKEKPLGDEDKKFN
jgi:hypothetical protein